MAGYPVGELVRIAFSHLVSRQAFPMPERAFAQTRIGGQGQSTSLRHDLRSYQGALGVGGDEAIGPQRCHQRRNLVSLGAADLIEGWVCLPLEAALGVPCGAPV